jgi:hypothetical protein
MAYTALERENQSKKLKPPFQGGFKESKSFVDKPAPNPEDTSTPTPAAPDRAFPSTSASHQVA